MSAITSAFPPATPTINPNDSRLVSDLQLQDGSWSPPADIDLSRDQLSTAEALASLDLRTKADSLCTCGHYFVPILQFSDHWARVGKIVCHLKFACRNCGTGKSRTHRLFTVAPKRFAVIVSEVTRTMRLTVQHESACATLADYRVRVQTDKIYMKTMRRKFMRGFGVGFMYAVELDPRMQDVTFRVYYVGTILDNRDVRECWQRIVGPRAYSTSRATWDLDPRKALSWTLDASCHILMLPGPERALWEQAFSGYRLTSSCGSLRGIDLENPAAEDTASDSAAPYGYCPCGCGGVVTKSERHGAASIATLSTRFKDLSFGPLKDYVAYSPKVNRPVSISGQFTLESASNSHSPPS